MIALSQRYGMVVAPPLLIRRFANSLSGCWLPGRPGLPGCEREPYGLLGVIDAELQAIDDRLERDVLVRECRTILLGYLTGGIDIGDGGSVDFFDVWG